ncbi:MAG: hypothetical protein Q7U14_12740, partial [Lacisediminimonas sp.]|nr:hypothetical protein [Lacisediminimonas sp.]
MFRKLIMRRPSRSVATSLLAISLWAIAPVAAFAADPVASEPVRAASGNDEVIANVNGKPIKLSDVALADEEMGSALVQLPEEKRFQYLLSMLIDRRIVADAARAKKMEDDPMVKAREAYFDEKVLRDVYWLQLMRDKVDSKAVKAYYDEVAALSQLGAIHEGAVSPAFATLLRTCASQFSRTLV